MNDGLPEEAKSSGRWKDTSPAPRPSRPAIATRPPLKPASTPVTRKSRNPKAKRELMDLVISISFSLIFQVFCLLKTTPAREIYILVGTRSAGRGDDTFEITPSQQEVRSAALHGR